MKTKEELGCNDCLGENCDDCETEDSPMKCPKCNTEMELLTEDEGGMSVYWCDICGAICESIDGEDEFRYPKKVR